MLIHNEKLMVTYKSNIKLRELNQNVFFLNQNGAFYLTLSNTFEDIQRHQEEFSNNLHPVE